MQNASTDLTERDELERVWERARRDEEAMDALDTASSSEGINKDEAKELAKAETILGEVLQSLTDRRDALEA